MNEIELIKTIENIVGTEYIGDDCAFLKELGIVISQDSLIENIHFKRDWATPYQLGCKSIAVNISDILAAGAEPKYVSIALSLPDSVENNFVEEFYNGAVSKLSGAKIIGGDITGSKSDIVVSVTAIGTTENRNISSRKNAKEGYIIITHGSYGSSKLGLEALKSGEKNNKFIKAHLEPELNPDFSEILSKNIKEPYAMMDTSDGLADALFRIAEASNVKIEADYSMIPHSKKAGKEFVLFGGEDYNLVAAIPDKYCKLISDAVIIGKVVKYDGIRLNISGEEYSEYNQLKVYNHFGE
jgi:thiamine-monophosphate kinase